MGQTFDETLAFQVFSMRINDEKPELGLAPHGKAHAGGGKDLHEVGLAHTCGGEDAHVVVHGLAMQGHGNLFYQS